VGDKDGFADFLLAHQEVPVETIDRTYLPLFDPARDMPRWLPRLSQVRAPGILPGQEGEGGLLANDNLMDALMKAVAQGRPGPALPAPGAQAQVSQVEGRVEWSGMEIAAVAKPMPILQPTLLPDHPQRVESEVDIVQVDVGGGATQLSWSGLELATATKPSHAFRPSKMGEGETKPKITRVKVKGGGVQLAFLCRSPGRKEQQAVPPKPCPKENGRDPSLGRTPPPFKGTSGPAI
jgi:hypothetical protein